MGKNRLEAFSDGVIAILITIMVLELKVPHGATIEALLPLWPLFLSYVLSFAHVGIYWSKLQYGFYLRRLFSYSPVRKGLLRYRARTFLGICLGLSLCVTLPSAFADTERERGDKAFRKGEYKEAYIRWFGGAHAGDSEQQELIADPLLGPHANAVKHDRYDGIQYLYRAAIAGRQSAMFKLSDMLRTGSFGAKKLPDAAKCWSAFPKGFQETLTCVEATAFSDNRARARCSDLAPAERSDKLRASNGVAMARLCLANKTPALLVPGTPPSPIDLRRISEYARYGIEWVITGDVYNGDFEKFRENFNNTIVEAIDAERGRRYLVTLGKQIEIRIAESPMKSMVPAKEKNGKKQD